MTKYLLSCLLILVSFLAIACGEEEKKSTTDTAGGDSSGSTSGSTSGTSGADGTSGGDDVSDDTSGGTSGGEDVPTSTTEDTTVEDTSGSTSGGNVDQCQNQPDLDYLVATISGGKHDGKTGRDAARAAASACGVANIAEADPRAETITCMKSDPENIGLSDGCTGCYGDIVLCTVTNCAGQCIADPSSTRCTDCQAQFGCVAAFDACTGPLP